MLTWKQKTRALNDFGPRTKGKMSQAPGGAGNPADVLTIISNIFFILPAIQAWMGKVWVLVMLYVLIIVNSSMYHACNSYASLCVFPSLNHRMMDFFFAQLIIPATAFTLILMPNSLRGLQTMSFIALAFTIFVIQIAVGESIYIQMGIALGSLGAIVVYWIIYGSRQAINEGAFTLPPYDWGHLTMGICMTGIACSLYSSEMQYHLLYWAVHSCWHAIAAYGQVFILMCRPPDPEGEYAVLNSVVGGAATHSYAAASRVPAHYRFTHKAPKSRV